MKIVYGSDLHLEIAGIDPVFPDGDILLLAGDIVVCADLKCSDQYTKSGMNGEEFLKLACQIYKHVIWVPGNHESYFECIDDQVSHVDKFCTENKITNLLFSETGVFVLDGVKFVWATMWTDINKANPMDMLSAYRMNDYKNITIKDSSLPLGGRYLTSDDTLRIHATHREFIENNTYHDGDVIVITHHAPDQMSCTEYSGPLNYFYCCTGLDEIFYNNPQIKYWIHGHTHENSNYVIGDTNIRSNCRGYVLGADFGFKFDIIEI